MKKLVIFDLDGTLLNTLVDICNSLNYALVSNGLSPYSNLEIRNMIGSGVDVLITKAIGDKKTKFTKVKESYLNHYSCHNDCETKPFSGIIEEIYKIKNKGYKMAVFSNKPDNDTQNIIFKYFGNIFDYVLGKKESNRIKPFPDGLNEIMNNLEIYNDCIFVGDSDVDIMTGKNANIKTIAVSWGYRDKTDLREADYIIDSPNELFKTIEEMNNERN